MRESEGAALCGRVTLETRVRYVHYIFLNKTVTIKSLCGKTACCVLAALPAIYKIVASHLSPSPLAPRDSALHCYCIATDIARTTAAVVKLFGPVRSLQDNGQLTH